ncbi:MAG: hypothetical protein JSS75_02060 [Bacteroidetes bacterium]|nr:hypothetical protein [Bacteroidota bacterium]
MKRIIPVFLALVVAASTTASFAAENIHIMMKGPRQSTKTVDCSNGACSADGLAPGEWTVTIVDANGKPLTSGKYKLTMSWSIVSPRDAASGQASGKMATAPRDVATGQASGKRQHKPITIVKEWGASSPQLRVASPSGAEAGDTFTVSFNYEKIEMK